MYTVLSIRKRHRVFKKVYVQKYDEANFHNILVSEYFFFITSRENVYKLPVLGILLLSVFYGKYWILYTYSGTHRRTYLWRYRRCFSMLLNGRLLFIGLLYGVSGTLHCTLFIFSAALLTRINGH